MTHMYVHYNTVYVRVRNTAVAGEAECHRLQVHKIYSDARTKRLAYGDAELSNWNSIAKVRPVDRFVRAAKTCIELTRTGNTNKYECSRSVF
jgi:hypothetical protein